MYFELKSGRFMDVGRGRNKLAFSCYDGDLSWAQLQKVTDTLCGLLEKNNVRDGMPVIVEGDRGKKFLSAVTACYRMQIPFVSLDSTFPKERKNQIGQLSGARFKIECRRGFDGYFNIRKTKSGGGNSIPGVAYIIFTSGSTGLPKGVVVSKENVLAFREKFLASLTYGSSSVFINLAAFSFDISLFDFFGCLQTGGSAVFAGGRGNFRMDEFLSRVQIHKGNIWNSTPSFVLSLLQHPQFCNQGLPQIKRFILSGEMLHTGLVEQLWERFPGAEIVNAYGPTETTIFASTCVVSKKMISDFPISVPVARREKDCDLIIQKNQIRVEGNQVSRGYIKDGKVVREGGFSRAGRNLFRTGDRCILRKGFVVFKGRGDRQIKFNGYRIELDEIVHHLLGIPGILQAECLPVIVKGRVKRLVAFLLVKSINSAPKQDDMRKKLLEVLPLWMIPSEFIFLDTFPMTDSGKVSRRELLAIL